MQLTGIFTYPIKSLGGISLTEARLTPRGLLYDRRWMLVTPEGRFLTQREHAVMALLEVSLGEEGFVVRHKHQEVEPLRIPLEPEDGRPMEVEVWDDRVHALRVSTFADAWLSEMLRMEVRLVYMPEEGQRQVDLRYAGEGELVSFADAFPFLIIGQASLDQLNARLPEPMEMKRFRPNFVFSGGEAHAEDSWKHFRIGEATFHAAKPCARCVLTTIHPETAKAGKEPLKTLATYRTVNNKVMFGMNLLIESGSRVRIGDMIETY